MKKFGSLSLIAILVLMSGCDTWPLKQEGSKKYNSSFSSIEKKLNALNWKKLDCKKVELGKTEAGEDYGTLLKQGMGDELFCFIKNEKSPEAYGASDMVQINAIFSHNADQKKINFEIWTVRHGNMNMNLVKKAKREIAEVLRADQ